MKKRKETMADSVAQENKDSEEDCREWIPVNTANLISDFRKKEDLEYEIECIHDAIDTFKNLRYRYTETIWWYGKLPIDTENEEVIRIIAICNKKIADYDRLIDLMYEYKIERLWEWE